MDIIRQCKYLGVSVKKNYNFGATRGYRTNGIVKYYIETKDIHKLSSVLDYAKNNKIKILGCSGGSNILILNKYDGIFINFKDASIKIFSQTNDKTLIQVGAGVKKSHLLDFCVQNSLKGLEFLAGIPGNVVGGLAMNAGAYGLEIGSFVDSVNLVTALGSKTFSAQKIKMSYRKFELPDDGIISSAVFVLTKGNKTEIQNKIDSYILNRKKKHPLYFPSCGSVFKNPEGTSKLSWQIIKEAGIDDLVYNGAKVSLLHSNFIINIGCSKNAEDFVYLISYIKNKIKNKFDIDLQEEVKIIK